ncbi:hypothetical protein llap_12790 [Limosa lapponica baueri]|uniref:Uncharacterized protein n=1 Tax=Limosa lapponica baueri TaxID=1758121 RepID=A0A2I0TT04_LIMLA|nr:hypothetical protein llap_12790 [Limosa lapponica baueri]
MYILQASKFEEEMIGLVCYNTFVITLPMPFNNVPLALTAVTAHTKSEALDVAWIKLMQTMPSSGLHSCCTVNTESLSGDTGVEKQTSRTGWLVAVWVVVGASIARVLATASSAGSAETLQAAVLLQTYIRLGCGPVGPLWQRNLCWLLSKDLVAKAAGFQISHKPWDRLALSKDSPSRSRALDLAGEPPVNIRSKQGGEVELILVLAKIEVDSILIAYYSETASLTDSFY